MEDDINTVNLRGWCRSGGGKGRGVSRKHVEGAKYAVEIGANESAQPLGLEEVVVICSVWPSRTRSA